MRNASSQPTSSNTGEPSASTPRRATGARSRSGSSWSCFSVDPFEQMNPWENTSSPIATNALHPTVLDRDLEPAGGLAERAGSKNHACIAGTGAWIICVHDWMLTRDCRRDQYSRRVVAAAILPQEGSGTVNGSRSAQIHLGIPHFSHPCQEVAQGRRLRVEPAARPRRRPAASMYPGADGSPPSVWVSSAVWPRRPCSPCSWPLAVTLGGTPEDLSLPFIGGDINEVGGFIAALSMAVVLLIVEITAARIITATAADLSARRRERILHAFFRANWDSQSEEREGSIQDFLFNHVGQVTAGFTALAGGAVSTAVLASLVFTAFVISPVSALLLVIVTLTLFPVLRPVTSAVHRRNRVLSAAARDYAQDVAETTGLTMEFRTLGVSDMFEADQIRKSNHLAALLRRARFIERLGGTLFRNLTLLIVLGTMGLLYSLDVASAPTLGLSLVLLLRSASYSQGIQNAVMFAGAVDPYLTRLENFEDRMKTTAHRTGGAVVHKIDELRVAAVDFAYSSDNVLHEVSFTITGGECLGIIGPSGSGKSTLTELLLRLREPTDGELFFNGHRGSEVADSSWYGQMGYVAQTPRLLTGTVAENIRFGRDLNDEAVTRRGTSGRARGRARRLDRRLGDNDRRPQHRSVRWSTPTHRLGSGPRRGTLDPAPRRTDELSRRRRRAGGGRNADQAQGNGDDGDRHPPTHRSGAV